MRSLTRSLLSGWIGCALVSLSGPAFSQTVIEFTNGMRGVAKYDKPAKTGPAQSQTAMPLIVPSGLTFFTGLFSSFGTGIPLTFIGPDPSRGSATSTTPTMLIPLKFVFSNGDSTDATAAAAKTVLSPVFQTTDFKSGTTDIGVTQYGDAIQRAEFWVLTRPGGIAPNYHALLGLPTVLPAQTITVPATKGFTAHLITNHFEVGLVEAGFFDGALALLLKQLGVQPNTVPIFLDADTFLYEGTPANCCIGGFHASTSGPIQTAQTWVFAVYFSPRDTAFGAGSGDVSALSHEVSEWYNDPFVGAFPGINLVAPYKDAFGGCQINLEDGDPLEAPLVTFTKTLNGFTYHLQDEAFAPWFLHTVPSFSVNRFYSFLGTFRTPNTLCGPG